MPRQTKFHVYRDRAGKYRWNLVAANGRIVADSGQGYVSRSECVSMASAISGIAGGAAVKDRKTGRILWSPDSQLPE